MEDVLKYKEYQAVVQFSTKDEVFFGTIGGITDLVTFEGGSEKALQFAFEEAVDDYLETCAELGKEPDKSCVIA